MKRAIDERKRILTTKGSLYILNLVNFKWQTAESTWLMFTHCRLDERPSDRMCSDTCMSYLLRRWRSVLQWTFSDKLASYIYTEVGLTKRLPIHVRADSSTILRVLTHCCAWSLLTIQRLVDSAPLIDKPLHFYSASALLAMQTAVISTAFRSVRLSVTVRCFVQKNEATIMRSSVSGSTMILVSGEVKFIRIFAGDRPQRGR